MLHHGLKLLFRIKICFFFGIFNIRIAVGLPQRVSIIRLYISLYFLDLFKLFESITEIMIYESLFLQQRTSAIMSSNLLWLFINIFPFFPPFIVSRLSSAGLYSKKVGYLRIEPAMSSLRISPSLDVKPNSVNLTCIKA